MKKLLYIILLLLFADHANAQFTVDGQIRPRFEHRNGYKQLTDSSKTASNFVSQRSRIRFAYKKDNIEMKLSFQDYHVWGDITPKKIESGLIGMHEGWAKVNFTSNCFIQVGRQELLYDNGRLITNSNWNQVGFTHDALKVGYNTELWQIETVFGYNQNGGTFGNEFYDGTSAYKALNIVWVSRKYDNLKLSFINVADLKQKNDSTNIDYLRITFGPMVNYKLNDLGIDFRAFYQGGKHQTGADVSAYYLNTDISYNLSDKVTITTGFELKSGTDASDADNTTNHSFDILYGARHKFNGMMDYFNVPSTTKGAGLIDMYLKGSYKATDKLSLMAQYHNFRLQNNLLDTYGENFDKALGNEIDLIAKFKFNKIIQLDLGFSTMFATKSMEMIKGGDRDMFTSYGYAMLTIKPVLFKQ